jgi:hypothetical protein
MSQRQIKGTFELSAVPSPEEPELDTLAFVVTPGGFVDETGVGHAGDAPGILPPQEVARRLQEQFDTDSVCALLDHLALLRDVLRAAR